MLDGFTGYDHGWSVEYHPRFVEDVNGDGRADIIGFYNDGVYVSYSESTGFTIPVKMYNDFGNSTGWTVEDHPRFVTDMNGDGKADLVAFGNYDVYVAFANDNDNDNSFGAKTVIVKNFFTRLSGTGWFVDKHPRFLEDVNGDGKKDVIGFASSGVYVSYSNANGGWDDPQRMIFRLGYASGWMVDMHPRFVTDMNGDGKADIIGFGGADVFVAYSNGNGFDAKIAVVSNFFVYGSGWRVTSHPRFLEDVDGDGNKDILGCYGDGVYVSFVNGNGGWDSAVRVSTAFGTNTGWMVARHPRFIADMNGDGKADIVGFANSTTAIRSFGY